MINGGGLGTYFSCTSTSTASQSVSIEVFNKDATAAGSGSLVVGPEQTVMFATTDALGLIEELLLGSPSVQKGSARILSTDKKLLCSAFIADTLNSPPSTTTYLAIIAKTKQKAAN